MQIPSTEVGASPGLPDNLPNTGPSIIQIMAYNATKFEEHKINDPAEIRNYLGKWPVIWVNVDGLGDKELVKKVGQIFGLSDLALEDVVLATEQAKVERYDQHLFIVARMVALQKNITNEQLNIFLGKNFVLTFQESHPGDCLDPVRNRIRKSLDRLRQSGPNYLVYALLDAVIDAYFPVLEQYGETLEEVENILIEYPERKVIAQLHSIKRDLLVLRRAIWPLRDAVNALFHDAPEFEDEQVRHYLRDCYDHAVKVIDLVEVYREVCADLQDVYLSSIANRTNEVMKTLTLISTIFLPLTFIAGVYGMNFNPHKSPLNMPELEWYWGYPFALSLMLVVGISLAIYFKRRNWL
ncbi:MAG: magnesium/cobalt transporter CorA [Chloroflexi bacterium]|nr:magnesium/cobalt transporter CorA [Chloroflexota bacterium]